MINKNILILLCLHFFLSSCIGSTSNDRLKTSEQALAYHEGPSLDFADYLTQTKKHLAANKIYLEPKNMSEELQAALPFETPPPAHCNGISPKKGILLIHGLSDMPFAMRDLSEAFAQRCFLVRSILLPGHGTRAGDLLEVSREDWLRATRFAIGTLKNDVEELYIGGFSLGGLIATHIAMENRDIQAVFAFSPAWFLKRSWQIQQSVWLRYIIDWADTDAPDDFARYEAMPMNALAETYLLASDLQKKLGSNSYPVPIFLIQSYDDGIINPQLNSKYFSSSFTSPKSRQLMYKQNPNHRENSLDTRIKYVDSYLPKRRIIGFSHQSIHISPSNKHYGPLGSYRNCGINGDRASSDVEKCLRAKEAWYAEITGDTTVQLPADTVPARLTFNPLFDEMMNEIDQFLSNVSTSTH